jgi:hypothetical protein
MQIIVLFIISVFVAVRARQLGYSGLLWFFASFLSMPLAAIGLLGALPNRRVDTIRKEEMQLLERQLKHARLTTRDDLPAPHGTISDTKTLRDD